MKATQRLHDLGQSLKLDNITRGLLTKGDSPPLYHRTFGDGAYLEPHDL
jgi:hypothetical protein